MNTGGRDVGLPAAALKRGRGARRDIIYLPTKQSHSRTTVLIGEACRTLLAAAYVSGVCLFVADSFTLWPDYVGLGSIIWPSIFFAAVIALLLHGGLLSAVGAVGLIGGITVRLAVVSVDFVNLIIRSVVAVHNTIIDRIIFAGLTSVRTLHIVFGSGDDVYAESIFSEEDLYCIGMMFIVLLVSVLIVPAIVRRCSAMYITLVTAVFVVPACVYNILRTNWGFSLLTAAIAGVFVLWTHDRSYTKPSRKKRLITEDEPIPLFTEEESADERHPKRRPKKKKIRCKEQVDDSIYVLMSNAERHRRRREEKREARAKARERARIARTRRKEGRRAERLDRRTISENAALGGVTGLVTMVLAMLIIALPAYFVSESDPGIPYLSDIMNVARKYVNAYLWSEEVDLNRVSSFGIYSGTTPEGPRPTDTVFPEYENVVLATVEVPYNTPVYLRSWIGTTYSDDHWYSATLYDVDEYKALFGDKFTPEMITENYYTAIHPNFEIYAQSSSYEDNTRIGFITERVSVTRKLGSTSLLYLPSFVRPSRGILEYNNPDSPSHLQYNYYFDGIWTSKLFFEGTRYTTESLVTTMRYPELGEVYADGIREYFTTMELIATGEPDTLIGAAPEAAAAYVGRMSSSLGVEEPKKTLLYRYITSMTDDERQKLREGAELERKYADYVRSTYLQTDESDNAEIRKIAKDVLRDGMEDKWLSEFSTDNYHTVVMTLIDYLDKNFTYVSKSPEAEDAEISAGDEVTDGRNDMAETYAPGDGSTPTAVIEFLTETHSGYCVQFASSLTLMLRSIGIPARYCEGFIVSEFKSNTGDDSSLAYTSDVLDSNAHAWVEVYYDGLGWVQYEATPPYHTAVYGDGLEEPPVTPSHQEPPAFPDLPGNHLPNNTPAEPEEPPVEIPSDSDPDMNLIVTAAISAGCALILIGSAVVCIIIIKKKSDRACCERAELIEKCADTDSPMTEEELRDFAHRLDIGIFGVYRALGLSPEVGELSDEYAERLDKAIGAASVMGVNTVLDMVSREEFGRSLSREGLAKLAGYYDELTSNVYDGLSLKNKFVMRGILRVI